MNVLILEDEPLVGENLVSMLRTMDPSLQITGPLASVREARTWLSSHPEPDLILADIQLSDGVSLDLFEGGKLQSPVIFTTAYNEYAIRAFKFNSIDYLLKPIVASELEDAFRQYRNLQQRFSTPAHLQELLRYLRQAETGGMPQYRDRFPVHQGKATLLIPQEETAWFVKDVIIYLHDTEGNSRITDYRSLDEIEEQVNPRQFYRANRQFLVNRAFTQGFKTDFTGKLTLVMKTLNYPVITVSKEKAAEFREWFGV